MKQTTRITIEHIVVASDRSYEQVIEALEAQLGPRADWDKIFRELITTNASWEQAIQIVEQQLGTSGFTILSKIEPGVLLRLSGKPGLTGPWQVYGRSRTPFQEMVEMDIAYLQQQSIWEDLKLIALTIPVMLQKRGGA